MLLQHSLDATPVPFKILHPSKIKAPRYIYIYIYYYNTRTSFITIFLIAQKDKYFSNAHNMKAN